MASALGSGLSCYTVCCCYTNRLCMACFDTCWVATSAVCATSIVLDASSAIHMHLICAFHASRTWHVQYSAVHSACSCQTQCTALTASGLQHVPLSYMHSASNCQSSCDGGPGNCWVGGAFTVAPGCTMQFQCTHIMPISLCHHRSPQDAEHIACHHV